MNYYLLSFAANGATTPAYYGVMMTSDGTFDETGAEISAVALGTSSVVGSDNILTISAPPGSVTGSASIATTAKSVAGEVQVNPAINVDLVVTLSGMYQVIAQYVLLAGQTSGSFSFALNGDECLTREMARSRVGPSDSSSRWR